MAARHGLRVVRFMVNEDKELITVARFERRLGEECGRLRLELAALRQEVVEGFGTLRAEMADRNAEQLKWLLVFFVAQTGALGALLALIR